MILRELETNGDHCRALAAPLSRFSLSHQDQDSGLGVRKGRCLRQIKEHRFDCQDPIWALWSHVQPQGSLDIKKSSFTLYLKL